MSRGRTSAGTSTQWTGECNDYEVGVDDSWEEISTAYVQFMRDFEASHNGFEITGAAVYFVKRIPEKPHGE